eukprot:358413-Chlamydomonas_euryale.AAC.14
MLPPQKNAERGWRWARVPGLEDGGATSIDTVGHTRCRLLAASHALPPAGPRQLRRQKRGKSPTPYPGFAEPDPVAPGWQGRVKARGGRRGGGAPLIPCCHLRLTAQHRHDLVKPGNMWRGRSCARTRLPSGGKRGGDTVLYESARTSSYEHSADTLLSAYPRLSWPMLTSPVRNHVFPNLEMTKGTLGREHRKH